MAVGKKILYRSMGYMHVDEGLIDILAGLQRLLLLDRCWVGSENVGFKPTMPWMDWLLR